MHAVFKQSRSYCQFLRRPRQLVLLSALHQPLRVSHAFTTLAPRRRASPASVAASLALKESLPPFPLPNGNSIKLVYLLTELEAYLDKIKNSDDKCTAFDMEWNMSRQKGTERRTGVIQIAHSEAGVLIYSINRSASFKLPNALLDYLTSSTILKCGVNVTGDIGKLKRDWPDLPACGGLVELSAMARRAEPDRWQGSKNSLISLQNLVAAYLGKYLDKGDVRISDWEGFAITRKQKEYAAGDVLASLDLYRVLAKLIADLPPSINQSVESSQSNVTTSTLSNGPPGLTPKQGEAWQRTFASSASSFELTRATDDMGIKVNSVLSHLLNAIRRVDTQKDSLSAEQARQLYDAAGTVNILRQKFSKEMRLLADIAEGSSRTEEAPTA